jgi:hypothetical protein
MASVFPTAWAAKSYGDVSNTQHKQWEGDDAYQGDDRNNDSEEE